MKLSTKGRYGLMAMYNLKENEGKGPIALKDIAKEENLSESYLEQLFSLLKKAGLVKSIRGAGGGYVLSRAPKDIAIGEIINALEGDISLSCCDLGKNINCGKLKDCATRDILSKLQGQIEDVMESMTLADM
ncbi:Rrf2 family transcriptional regulator [Peptoniphilus sp. AGMB00490]|uniref:Rrf2 family transcriptional regulator n=2 Tax=Peptoniphilus TaxID=162289 RepID=A0ACD6AZ83_9FIRM|nr:MULTISPECIES: Rrf2 family transcriptional regulator [Peptoniphilus]NMW85553.1 Rrf2 family transcriptional regulator [Peptoniphilus faecalis]OLR64636.1 AsnC family transcriptional regulator [Peptoniphilus porci]